MDADRYARIRELFFAADDLPHDERDAFLASEADGDQTLVAEVQSLLREHNPAQAQAEGENAAPPPMERFAGNPKPHTAIRSNRQDRPDKRLIMGGNDHDVPATATFRDHAPAGFDDDPGKTRPAAARTHAGPRQINDASEGKRVPDARPAIALWTQRTRRSRRRASAWLWLTAILPTVLVGLWTYHQVSKTMDQSIRNEMASVVESLALASERFLDDQTDLVRSWVRQPDVRDAVLTLVGKDREEWSVEQRREAQEIATIHDRLRELTGEPEVKFVVWDRSFVTVASWVKDHADVGNPVPPSGAANLAKAMSGQTVIFGPERFGETTEGFTPETSDPVMAVIVPVRDDDGRVVAAILVRGIDMFENYNQIIDNIARANQFDAYAISRDGVMLTNSPNAVFLASQGRMDVPRSMIAANLKVTDPGFVLTRSNADDLQRRYCPVTIAAAELVRGRGRDARTEPYRNYAGESVVGAWQWNEDRQVGVIVEQPSERAFAAARIVRTSFLALTALLATTGFLAAGYIAKKSTAEHAAVHPLSRYEVLGELGRGGMGIVYHARHRQLGRETALKVLRGDRQHHEDQLRFDREARLAASLSNPHAVTIYDYGRSPDGESFCVMELLRGLTLQQVVARGGYQPVGRVLHILRQICDALVEAHATHLTHRDIKPQNIMLSLDPSVGDWAVLFDFGLAKPLEPDSSVFQTSETIWSGTPMYMPPERFRNPLDMDPRSDIYSVGCVGYYLLAGRPPFAESNPESLFAQIIKERPIDIGIHRGQPLPTEVADVVLRCMAKDVDNRHATVIELGADIDRLRTKYPWSPAEADQWWRRHDADE